MYNLTIGVIQLPPFLIWENAEENELKTNFVPLLRVFDFFKKGNIKLIPKLLIDEKKIGVYKNGQWSGIIGMLQRKEVELTMLESCIQVSNLPGEVIPMFHEVGDYIVSIVNNTFEKKSRISDGIYVVDMSIWLLILFTIFVLAGFLNFLYFKKFPNFKSYLLNSLNTAWVLVATLVCQYFLNVKHFRAIIVYLSFMFLSMQFTAFLKSFFSTNLIVHIREKRIETLEDVIESGLIPYILEGELIVHNIFYASSSAFQKLKDTILDHGKEKCIIPYDIPQFLSKLGFQYFGKYVFMGSETVIKAIILNPSLEIFANGKYTPYVSEKALIKCLYSTRLQVFENSLNGKRTAVLQHCARIFESGLYEFSWTYGLNNLFPVSWELRYHNLINLPGQTTAQLNFQDSNFIVFFLSIGFLCSLVILIIELMLKRLNIL